MTSWKTTVCGLVAAAAGGIAAANISPGITQIAMMVAAIATGMLGVVSKDHNVTGGTKAQ